MVGWMDEGIILFQVLPASLSMYVCVSCMIIKYYMGHNALDH